MAEASFYKILIEGIAQYFGRRPNNKNTQKEQSAVKTVHLPFCCIVWYTVEWLLCNKTRKKYQCKTKTAPALRGKVYVRLCR